MTNDSTSNSTPGPVVSGTPPLAPTKPSKFYSPQVDILKALAIIFVVAFHFFPGALGWHLKVMPPGWFENYWHQPNANMLQFLESYLYLGVNFFVITSGFGLYLSYLKSAKPLNLKEFFQKRVLRLMPAAILSIVIIFLVKGLFLHQWVTQNFLLNLFPFLGGLNLFSDNWFFPPINGEMWFLGLIIQLYLFFPLLLWLYQKVGEKKFLILLLAISVVFRALYYLFLKDGFTSLSYGLSLGRLFEFGFGMVLAKNFVDKNSQKSLSPWWLLGLPFGLAYFWPWSFPFADGLVGVGFFTLIWLIVAKFPPHSWWGKIAAQSYLIFLLHHPFIWILEGLGFHDEWSLVGLLVFALFFTFSYGLAKAAQWILDGIDQLSNRFTAKQQR